MSLKFRCDRNSFLSAVSGANRATPKHSSLMAALTGVYLKLEDDTLTLTGSDLDLTITVTTSVAGLESGSSVIPAKLLLDVVRVLPVGSLNLEATENEVRISSGSTEFSIRVLSVDDWPVLPTVESDLDGQTLDDVSDQDDDSSASADSDAYTVTADGGAFREALNQVVRSASTDETRLVLTGVLMAAEGEGLRLVSTDSYRLSMRDLPGSRLLGQKQQVLVPGRALRELQRVIGDSDQITLRLSDKRAEFEVGQMRMTTRLIEGDFPKYQGLLPSPDTHPNVLTIQRDRLLEAVLRVRLLAQDSTPVRMIMTTDRLELQAATQDVGSASEAMEAYYTGEDLTIAFNPAYLVDGLEVVATEEVTLRLLDALKPALLCPVGDDSFQYLLMPVRVS